MDNEISGKPKVRPDNNPWYRLATLHGQPSGDDEALRARNRGAWNRYVASRIGDNTKARLIEAGSHSVEELTPFSQEELEVVQKVLAERAGIPVAKFPALSDFSNVEFDAPFYIRGFVFPGWASFENATFSGRDDLRSVNFSAGVDFTGATFSGGVRFGSATFSAEAKFAGATFSNQADFKSATFSSEAGFGNATFSGEANFGSATFSGEAKFPGATFSGGSDFGSATFSGLAYFTGAKFSERADFISAKFYGGANFRSAIFSKRADFAGAILSSSTFFVSAKFCGGAYFPNTTFSGEAAFGNVTFSGEADFGRATFSGEANFGSAKFSGKADFGGVTFSGVASFGSAKFSGEADFVCVTFSRKVEFVSVTFSGKADFRRVTFSGEADFGRVKTKGDTSFNNAIFSEPPKFFGAKLQQGTLWDEVRWPEPPKDAHQARQFVAAYERLKLEMDQLKKHVDELDFFTRELQCRRIMLGGDWKSVSELKLRGWAIPLKIPVLMFRRRPYRLFGRPVTLPSLTVPARTIQLYRPTRGIATVLYGILCDYGRNYVRPLHLLCWAVVVGALLFWTHLDLSHAFGISFANTFSVLGIRKDLIAEKILVDLPGWLKVVATAQTVSGIVLLFLFGVGIRNSFRMN